MRIGRRAMLGAVLAAPALAATEYPGRPVRLVVGYPAGGSTDLVARLLAERLFRAWGQPVTVENRGGAAGTLGADLVAKAAPDGYTLLIGASAEMAIARAVMRNIPYQPEDFAPVALLTEQPFLVLVNAALPVRSLAELVALAREQPGKLNYASHGTGTANHLLTELLRVETGIGDHPYPLSRRRAGDDGPGLGPGADAAGRHPLRAAASPLGPRPCAGALPCHALGHPGRGADDGRGRLPLPGRQHLVDAGRAGADAGAGAGADRARPCRRRCGRR